MDLGLMHCLNRLDMFGSLLCSLLINLPHKDRLIGNFAKKVMQELCGNYAGSAYTPVAIFSVGPTVNLPLVR